jgi:hypothetical protein
LNYTSQNADSTIAGASTPAGRRWL